MPAVLHVVFNPVAGKGRSLRALGRIENFLRSHELAYELFTTKHEGHATELAAAAPAGSTVVVVGGDGTVHEALKGLLSGQQADRPALAVVPVGSGDDFAFSLGIARNDLEAALGRLVTGDLKRIDVGYMNGEPFANSTGVGFDAEAAHRVRTSPRFLKGLAAYVYGTLSALSEFRPVEVRVTVDGEEAYVGPSLLVSLQNGPRTGGSFLFAPEARNDDGLLDVLVAGEFTRAGAVAVMPRLMKGRHLSHPRVHLFRGNRVELSWAAPQRAHADGEPLGPTTDYSAKVCEGVLEVVV